MCALCNDNMYIYYRGEFTVEGRVDPNPQDEVLCLEHRLVVVPVQHHDLHLHLVQLLQEESIAGENQNMIELRI